MEMSIVKGADITTPVLEPSQVGTKELTINERYPKQGLWIGAGLPNTLRQGLTKLLKGSINVFDLQLSDMTGVTRKLTEHKSNDRPGNKLVHKQKRGQSKYTNKAINDEVDKLFNAGKMTKSIFSSWVANVVLVKKEDKQWQMGIDFTNLNKACPKDCYILPFIDEKIECL